MPPTCTMCTLENPSRVLRPGVRDVLGTVQCLRLRNQIQKAVKRQEQDMAHDVFKGLSLSPAARQTGGSNLGAQACWLPNARLDQLTIRPGCCIPATRMLSGDEVSSVPVEDVSTQAEAHFAGSDGNLNDGDGTSCAFFLYLPLSYLRSHICPGKRIKALYQSQVHVVLLVLICKPSTNQDLHLEPG